jgi:hypothetical protein
MQERPEYTTRVLRPFTDAGDIQGGIAPLFNTSPIMRVSQRRLMEAERINQIASTLSDLDKRSAELRRYL